MSKATSPSGDAGGPEFTDSVTRSGIFQEGTLWQANIDSRQLISNPWSIRHCSKGFAGDQLLIMFFLFYRWGNWSIKKQNNLPKVTQLGSGRAKTWILGGLGPKAMLHAWTPRRETNTHCLQVKVTSQCGISPASWKTKAKTDLSGLCWPEQTPQAHQVNRAKQTSLWTIELQNPPCGMQTRIGLWNQLDLSGVGEQLEDQCTDSGLNWNKKAGLSLRQTFPVTLNSAYSCPWFIY